jgi:hypothetical protein
MMISVSKFNGKKFTIDADALDQDCDQFRLYAKTSRETEVATAYLAAIVKLNDLIELGMPALVVKKDNERWLSNDHEEIGINFSMYGRLVRQ